MEKTVNRMGKWIEFDNSYKTMDNDYLETIWYIFKKLFDTDYIYEGKKFYYIVLDVKLHYQIQKLQWIKVTKM